MSDNTAQGFWLDSGIRNVPAGQLEWTGIPRRAYSASVDGSPVASVRRLLQGGWAARIEGWRWHVTPDMPSARFKLKEVPTKLFDTAPLAKKAVEEAFKMLTEAKEALKQEGKSS